MRKLYQKYAEKLCSIPQELIWHMILGYLISEVVYKISYHLFHLFWLSWSFGILISFGISYLKEVWDQKQKEDFFDRIDIKYGLYGILTWALLALL